MDYLNLGGANYDECINRLFVHMTDIVYVLGMEAFYKESILDSDFDFIFLDSNNR